MFKVYILYWNNIFQKETQTYLGSVCVCVCLRVCTGVYILCGALGLPNKGVCLLRLVLFKMYCNKDSALDKLSQEYEQNE